ncbi:MAG: aminoacyl-tRNA hydrolase [Gemmatimonadaceae bacterium]
MKVIFGLGNPGAEYEHTRHNVGWWLVDHLADVWRFDGWRKDGNARVASGTVGRNRVRLVKPQTYMNLSGGALRPYLRRESWSPRNDLFVVVDDAAIPVGTYRLRATGSSGGHNGLRSIETALGSQEYPRLRIGVGPPPGRERRGDLADFVLDRLGKAEAAEIRELLPRLREATETWLTDGIEVAMNRFNRR